jgi:putative SOS response-associated peptidase YedK
MRNFHKPSDEKRMVVVLPEDSYTAWLAATVEGSMDFMRRYRDDGLVADGLTTLAASHRNAELF